MPMPHFDQAALNRATVLVQMQEAPVSASESAGDPNATPRKAQSGIGIAPYLALAGGEGADIGSTLLARSRGGHESNPLLGDFGPAAIALKAGMAVPMVLLMRYLARHGHPTLAKGLGYGTGAALGGIAAHNLTVGR